MKNALLCKIAGMLFCLTFISDMAFASSSTNHCFQNHRLIKVYYSPGPVDELISLLEEYGNAMASSNDKAACDSLETELSNKIATLDTKYPGFEPNYNDMAQIEKAFTRYIELTEVTGYFEEDDYDDSLEILSQIEKLSEIYENYSGIDDVGDRFLAITHDYTKKIESSSDITEIIDLTNQYTGIVENFFDDFEPADSEKPKFESALEMLGNTVNTTMDKLMQDNK